MAQLSEDCFAFGGAMLPLEAAVQQVRAAHACVMQVERVWLGRAVGRVLAEDVAAPFDLPRQTNSAVDGYALRHGDLALDSPTLLRLHGRVAAGQAAPGAVAPGFASRVFTGAVLPDGADTVMMQEDCEATADGVLVRPGIRRGANRRPAGEDVASGTIALPAGRRLMPPDIGLLAAFGCNDVAVRGRLRVGLFSTGDELVDPPAIPGPGRTYDANRHMLAALLDRLGMDVLDGGILPDAAGPTGRALRRAAGLVDVILTSGGVSTGEEDHVRDAIIAEGSLEFWRVAIKPGRPVALGKIGGVPLLGLPGNPVAALVTFSLLGRPLLEALGGVAPVALPRFAVPSGFVHRKKPGRREYLRVQIGADGLARRHPKEGAGILTSLTGSDALMELEETILEVVPGMALPCIPMGALHG